MLSKKFNAERREGGPNGEAEDEKEEQHGGRLSLFLRGGHHLGAEGHDRVAEVAVGERENGHEDQVGRVRFKDNL